jgi:hypothetical protein
MNSETIRQTIILFLSMFKDMGYTGLHKVNRSGMEISLTMNAMIADLEAEEIGAMDLVREISAKLEEGGRGVSAIQDRRALHELSLAIRRYAGVEVLGEPHVASALREAESVLGIRIER